VVSVWPAFDGPGFTPGAETIWPAAPLSEQDLQRLPIVSIVVETDGSRAAIEQARTRLELGYPRVERPPATLDDKAADTTKTLAQWQQLANVVILASLPIAGCSLAVSIAGGLSERKRPFSLLRLTGVPLRMLRRVVALESAVPLLVVAVVAIGTGLFAAHLFLRAQMEYDLIPPGAGYYAIVLAGLAASLGIIASTLPLLRRITGPETARNE
jgi:predicted lysophospholipase L1 biosynthesis ABC-type transport system permease subunit